VPFDWRRNEMGERLKLLSDSRKSFSSSPRSLCHQACVHDNWSLASSDLTKSCTMILFPWPAIALPVVPGDVRQRAVAQETAARAGKERRRRS
jgi:hypothetical protein